MTKPKKKLVASFKGPIAQAFATDRVELTGKYHNYCGWTRMAAT
jgi:hypothetical protein